jgi:lysozyme
MRAALDGLVLAVKLIMGFEGCRLTAYQDIVGVWTIGWGETLGVHEGMVWTQEQADERLRARVGFFMLEAMRKCPQLFLEPPERAAACTSLAYNIGLGAFAASSVCRKTGYQDFEGAALAFLLWNKAGGRPVRGLTLRRQAESATYSQPDRSAA